MSDEKIDLKKVNKLEVKKTLHLNALNAAVYPGTELKKGDKRFEALVETIAEKDCTCDERNEGAIVLVTELEEADDDDGKDEDKDKGEDEGKEDDKEDPKKNTKKPSSKSKKSKKKAKKKSKTSNKKGDK